MNRREWFCTALAAAVAAGSYEEIVAPPRCVFISDEWKPPPESRSIEVFDDDGSVEHTCWTVINGRVKIAKTKSCHSS